MPEEKTLISQPDALINSHHRSPRVAEIYDNSPRVPSRALPSPSLERQQLDYHRSLCNYCYRYYSNYAYLKWPETEMSEKFLLEFTLSKDDKVVSQKRAPSINSQGGQTLQYDRRYGISTTVHSSSPHRFDLQAFR